MNLIHRFLPGLTETSRDRYTDAAAAELVPLAAEYRSIPSPSEASRRAVRDALNSPKKER